MKASKEKSRHGQACNMYLSIAHSNWPNIYGIPEGLLVRLVFRV